MMWVAFVISDQMWSEKVVQGSSLPSLPVNQKSTHQGMSISNTVKLESWFCCLETVSTKLCPSDTWGCKPKWVNERTLNFTHQLNASRLSSTQFTNDCCQVHPSRLIFLVMQVSFKKTVICFCIKTHPELHSPYTALVYADSPHRNLSPSCFNLQL